MDDMETIGSRIKSRRIELGLKQTKIKEYVGISSGNLSEIENGKRSPSMQNLYKLSEVLNCSIDWIVKGDSLNPEKISFSELRESEKQLIMQFRSLSEEDRIEINMIMQMKYDRHMKKVESSLSGDKHVLTETA